MNFFPLCKKPSYNFCMFTLQMSMSTLQKSVSKVFNKIWTCYTKVAISRLIMVWFSIWKKFWNLQVGRKKKIKQKCNFNILSALKTAYRSLHRPRNQLSMASVSLCQSYPPILNVFQGGTLVDYEGTLRLLEIAQVPKDRVSTVVYPRRVLF